ncbi:MAG: hypothetical protein RPV21_01655 [Candidatus Sedimenticola sp. (ex Thyasira tokunagai)]
MRTSDKKQRYKPPKGARAQISLLASNYVRHGSKENRRKQIKRLITACEIVMERFRLNDIRQIGNKQVRWHYEQLRQQGMSDKTLKNYEYGWQTLWTLLERLGQPSTPRLNKKI